MPAWSDTLLQDVIRSVREASDELYFSEHAHGSRPERGCQTAFRHSAHAWTGCHWCGEGDRKACVDRRDHSVMVSILAEKIHDPRFLRLITQVLQAGYREEWRSLPTLSGVHQGGIVSPILSNISLEKLDTCVETYLSSRLLRGQVRKKNPADSRLQERLSRARRKEEYRQANALRRKTQHLPAG
jgi:retron-type reverse transcriptase